MLHERLNNRRRLLNHDLNIWPQPLFIAAPGVTPAPRVTTSSLEEEVYPTGAGETRRAAHPLSSHSSRFLEARFLLRSSTSRARHALLPHRTMCALFSSGFDQMFISWLRSLRRLLNRSCSMQQSSSSHAAYRSLPVPNLVPTSGTSTTVKLCCVFPL